MMAYNSTKTNNDKYTVIKYASPNNMKTYSQQYIEEAEHDMINTV